jgi:signal transduction histidine kinase
VFGRRIVFVQSDGDRMIGAVTVFADITERLKIEQIHANELEALERQVQTTARELGETRAEFQQLSGRLMMAHEEERRRLASELHDDLGQKTAVEGTNLVVRVPFENSLNRVA